MKKYVNFVNKRAPYFLQIQQAAVTSPNLNVLARTQRNAVCLIFNFLPFIISIDAIFFIRAHCSHVEVHSISFEVSFSSFYLFY